MAATAKELAAYRAVGTIYNALMTALILGLITRRGEATARDYVFRHFRHQHLEKFLPGLQKLGLADQPDAPACALYHYHSNALGGVKTGYLRENDRKAWVRYPPPRWIWRGTAIAAVPHSVSAAMLHGWHGHNGVSLGNPGLGFVCTGMTVDGMPGLEGYYLDYDRPIAEHERVRFAYGTEEMPRVDWQRQPALETASWPRNVASAPFAPTPWNICAPCCRPCRSCWVPPTHSRSSAAAPGWSGCSSTRRRPATWICRPTSSAAIARVRTISRAG